MWTRTYSRKRDRGYDSTICKTSNREDIRQWYCNYQTSQGAAPKAKWIDTIDLEIKPFIVWLNQLPGCATICSCAGYGLRQGSQEPHSPEDRPYLFIYCTNPEVMFVLVAASSMVNSTVTLCSADNTAIGKSAITIYFESPTDIKRYESYAREGVVMFSNNGDLETVFKKEKEW